MAPKKQPPNEILSGSGGEAVNNSAHHAVANKSQASPRQHHAGVDASKKKKNRLQSSSAGNSGQAIDLTGEDSDTVPASKSTASKNQQQPTPKIENEPNNTQHPANAPPAPGLAPSTANPPTSPNIHTVIGTSAPEIGTAATDSQRATNTAIPPGFAPLPLTPQPNINTAAHLTTPTDRPIKRARMDDPASSEKILVTPTVQQYRNMEPPSYLTRTTTNFAARSPLPPSFAKKLDMSREIAAALGISQRDAYQLLLENGWVGDHAMLAYLGRAGGWKEE